MKIAGSALPLLLQCHGLLDTIQLVLTELHRGHKFAHIGANWIALWCNGDVAVGLVLKRGGGMRWSCCCCGGGGGVKSGGMLW